MDRSNGRLIGNDHRYSATKGSNGKKVDREYACASSGFVS